MGMSQKKIKILFTINNLNTAGMKLVLKDIAQQLDPNEFDPYINVLEYADTDTERELRERFTILNITLKPKKRPKLSYLPKIWKATQQLKKHNFDIAHSFDYASDFGEGLVMKLAGVPWVAEKTNLAYEPNRWRRRLTLATRIVALSKAQASLFPEYANKVTIIPTGVDLDLYERTPAKARAEMNLSEDDLVLISVAQVVSIKAHKEIVQAYKDIEDKVPNLKILFAGRDEDIYAIETKEMIKKYGLEDKIRFLGMRSDIPALLKMADGKILATRNINQREGFGAALVEAMSAGIPVIGTKSGGPEEIIEHDYNGWIVDAIGHEPLIGPMLEFYNDAAKRAELGKNALQTVKDKFTFPTMLESYSQVYREVAKN